MDKAFEQTIRDRAYAIWMAAGMDGDAEHHWLVAEHAILNEASPPAMPVTKASSPAATKTKPVAKAKDAKAAPKKNALARAPKIAAGSAVAQA